jgi:hypothetical protein
MRALTRAYPVVFFASTWTTEEGCVSLLGLNSLSIQGQKDRLREGRMSSLICSSMTLAEWIVRTSLHAVNIPYNGFSKAYPSHKVHGHIPTDGRSLSSNPRVFNQFVRFFVVFRLASHPGDRRLFT